MDIVNSETKFDQRAASKSGQMGQLYSFNTEARVSLQKKGQKDYKSQRSGRTGLEQHFQDMIRLAHEHAGQTCQHYSTKRGGAHEPLTEELLTADGFWAGELVFIGWPHFRE